jgi:hypothetical protein
MWTINLINKLRPCSNQYEIESCSVPETLSESYLSLFRSRAREPDLNFDQQMSPRALGA